MRTAAVVVVLLAACSVERKVPLTDGGIDDGPPIDAVPDDFAPDTVIESGPDEFSRLGSSTFRFHSDDPTATFECSIDGETPVVCSSPYTRTLGDGPHTASVRAIDPAGNGDDTPAEHLWTIDTVAPDTIMLQGPPGADNSTMVQFAFDSTERNVSFECSLDNAAYLACTSGATFGPVGDGAHAFAVRARDRAGNVDSSPAIHAWLVDTSTPDTQLIMGPSGAVATTTATFTFVSPDAGSGATYQCSLDGAAYVSCTSPRDLVGLAAGNHSFAVRVRDAVGNLDPTPAVRTWTVDLTPPNTTITSGPNGLESTASASFVFTSNEADVTYTCSLDNAAYAPCTSPYNAPALAQGAHAFAVRATDEAGHTDASPATRAWTVDTVAPDVAIVSGPAAGETTGPRVSFGFTVSDGTIACSLDGAPFTGCASPVAFNAPAGAHQFRIRATDAAGNAATETRAWTIACAAPGAADAAALLHLDDTGQQLANAVAGGAPGTLGDDDTAEVIDPSPATGRFGGGLDFSAGTRAAWPVALAALPALTFELWARPDAGAGARDMIATGDGRFVVRVTAVSPTTVRFTATAIEAGAGGQSFVATSGVVAAGAWHHVVVSLDEPALRLWVDGARSEVGNVGLGTPPAVEAIQLGGTYAGGLDEVWVAQTPIATDEGVLARYCPL